MPDSESKVSYCSLEELGASGGLKCVSCTKLRQVIKSDDDNQRLVPIIVIKGFGRPVEVKQMFYIQVFLFYMYGVIEGMQEVIVGNDGMLLLTEHYFTCMDGKPLEPIDIPFIPKPTPQLKRKRK